MQRRLFRGRHNRTAKLLQQTVVSRNTNASKASLKLAPLLVFLVAIFGSIVAIKQGQASENSVPAPESVNTLSVQAEKNTESNGADSVQSSFTIGEPVPSSATNNSVIVESNIVNGESETTVEINGEKIHVPNNSSTTHTSIQNGNQTTATVNIQNSQTNGTSSSFGANTSSSFSHSFDSQNTVGGN